MEVIAGLAIIGAIWYAANKAAQGAPVPGGQSGPGAGPVGQDQPPGGSGPTPPAGPPPAPPPLATGVYPAGTAGTLPIVVSVLGGDGDCHVSVQPGGDVGPNPGDTKTFWYGPGTQVVFRAYVAPGFASFLEAFDHWEGPGGITTKANLIIESIGTAGFVRAHFAWAGQVA